MSLASLRIRERWNATDRVSGPSIRSSTVTASRSCPVTRLQAPLDSASGSIGSTAPGTYTLVARRAVSRSSAVPGRTYALTSAMWIHMRIRPPSARSADTASS